MNILRCTPEQLKSEAGKISLQGENLAAKVDSMISVVDSIGDQSVDLHDVVT